MCGIVGIGSKNALMQRAWLSVGRDAIAHRGPDYAGEWWSEDGCVGLAHRRLSIINLASNGNQPMSDDCGHLQIVFNGEIYNYQALRAQLRSQGSVFRSESDTEVILAAYQKWGLNCLEHLNGMFAFALYDQRERKLFLARDRAGEKPLFYRHSPTDFRFSSELKALLVDPNISRRMDQTSLDLYLAYGRVPGNQCILRDFNKLSPGEALCYDLNSGNLKTWRYWQVPELETIVEDENALLTELESLLEDSVRQQLVADVHVGVLLSGGIDSSLITAMAVRSVSKVKTFTVRFPGHGVLDETPHARLIAQHFNTEHIELEVTPSTAEILPMLARQFDEPMADSSMIPTFMVSQLIRQYCSVALGGDGGDELFGGYGHYSRLLLMARYMLKIPGPLPKSIGYLAERLLPVGFKGRNWLQGLGEYARNSVPIGAPFFDATTRRHLMSKHGSWQVSAESIMELRMPQAADLLQRATRNDFSNYLAEDILVKVDRASMLNSLEVRAPFLDHRIIEFAFSKVPSRLKATETNKKILLKKLVERVLPPEFDKQRKQGFSIPLAEWLKKGAFRSLFYDVLLDSDSVFDRKVVSKLLKGQERGKSNSERLFALVLFELWRRDYKISG